MDLNNNKIYNTSNVYKQMYVQVSKNLYKPIGYYPYIDSNKINYPEFSERKEKQIGGE